MEKSGQYYLRKEVTFIFEKKEYSTIITPKTDFDLITKTLKKTFHLKSPFVLKYRIYDNSFVAIRDQAALMNYIKQRFFAYNIYVQHDDSPQKSSLVPFKATQGHVTPNPPENKFPALTFQKTQSPDENRSLNSSSWSNSDASIPRDYSSKGRSNAYQKKPQVASNYWGIKKPTKKEPKPVYPLEPQPKPTPSIPKSAIAERAQEIQSIAMKYQKALESHPSLLLTSQLLVDQILNGANINLEVLKKTLQRRAIADTFSLNRVPAQQKYIEPAKSPTANQPEEQKPEPVNTEYNWKAEVEHLAAEIDAFGIPMDD
ncbi:hypothetical protein DSO57_1003439 [Entomophthora muscae]|uniref:Uncharacterized protein n=2 Tax=Entomophthora muscae TaxID=34485 RepID=A0ACC2UI35_9FUNG|nr:hypothetical protein DSO57_1003439 [Entomophthora muscae]